MIPGIELYFVELYLVELYLVERPSASPRSRPLTADYTALVGTPQSTSVPVQPRSRLGFDSIANSGGIKA
jgi:hypothetical protein